MQDSAGHRYKSDSDSALKAEPCPDDSARWESFVSSMRSIPVLAQSVYRLSNLLMVPPVDLSAITRVACTDLGLAAQLLKLVNSGISDVPVHDLDYAVVQLGVDPLRAFILSVPILPSDGPLPVMGLWEHAVQCGEVCAWLARKAQYEHQNRAYIAGLLHDLGRFPLIAWQLATHHGELKHSMRLVYATPEQEDERFGINHQVIGGWMAVTWNLPDFLVEVMERHHLRSLPGDSLVELVRAADCFCNRRASHASQIELLEALSPITSSGNEQKLLAQLCEAFPAGVNRANNHYFHEGKDF